MTNIAMFGCAAMAVLLALAGLFIPAVMCGAVVVWLMYREIYDE